MSRPKRHHFVPQFHLRRFSSDGRSVRCFNKSRRKLIECAPIKGQCSIENFYDWHPDVEKTLGYVEGAVSPLIAKICEAGSLSGIDKDGWSLLLLFIAIPSGRVKALGDANDKITDHFVKIQASGASSLKGIDLDKFIIRNNYPAALPLEVSIKASEYLSSLDVCILVNKSKFPFFLSDNPVLRYNNHAAWVQHSGVIGYDCSGLQVFYFLDEKTALYLFDANTYSQPSNTGVRVVSLDDAIAINMMHYLWSDENIYISGRQNAEVICEMARALAEHEDFNRIEIVETESIKQPDGKTGSVVMHWHCHVPMEIELRFARVRSDYDEDKHMRSKAKRTSLQEQDPSNLIAYRILNPPNRRNLKGFELSATIRRIEQAIRQATTSALAAENCADSALNSTSIPPT